MHAPQKPNLSDAIHSLLKKADLALHSSDLFGKNGVVLILHENASYQLKKTRYNKLVLNK